jgi:hypothetical protein
MARMLYLRSIVSIIDRFHNIKRSPKGISKVFDRFAEQREAKQTYGYIGEVIAQDKIGKLHNTYLEGRPYCNAQVVLSSYWQEEQLQTLIDRLNVGYCPKKIPQHKVNPRSQKILWLPLEN